MKLASLRQHSLLYPLGSILLRRFAKGLTATTNTTFLRSSFPRKRKRLLMTTLPAFDYFAIGIGCD
jgi:hypothetical protein